MDKLQGVDILPFSELNVINFFGFFINLSSTFNLDKIELFLPQHVLNLMRFPI